MKKILKPLWLDESNGGIQESPDWQRSIMDDEDEELFALPHYPSVHLDPEPEKKPVRRRGWIYKTTMWIYLTGLVISWYPFFLFLWTLWRPKNMLHVVELGGLAFLLDLIWPIAWLTMLLDWLSTIPVK
jgi:hypothetical protein